MEHGTEVTLPTEETLVLEDNSEVQAMVTWNTGTPNYNKDTAGTYTFEVIITLPSNVTNTNNLKATVTVIVA